MVVEKVAPASSENSMPFSVATQIRNPSSPSVLAATAELRELARGR